MPYVQAELRPSLFYRDWGSGTPVLFCSSWALTGAQFQYQMAHLVERGFRAISYDRRGHGRSDDPGGGFDYDTLADDLAAVIEHLDLRELTLVGHSMAGGEIVRYLTRHGGQRVARIVLLAATLPFPLKTDANPDGIDASVFEGARAEWHRDYGQWLEDNQGPFFGDGLPGCWVSEYVRRWTMADALSSSLLAVIECNRAMAETDFRAEMRELRTPTLIIHGDHDASIPIELSGLKQAELLPHSHLIVYENAPHGLYLTHGSRFNHDLTSFIEDNAASTAERGTTVAGS
jgi:non-heme chloroperoxidase